MIFTIPTALTVSISSMVELESSINDVLMKIVSILNAFDSLHLLHLNLAKKYCREPFETEGKTYTTINSIFFESEIPINILYVLVLNF